jgi:uncharacterized membrane-anchored protein YjiN (DUF445 family)
VRKPTFRDQQIESLVAKAKSMGITPDTLAPTVNGLLEKLITDRRNQKMAKEFMELGAAITSGNLPAQLAYIFDTIGHARAESILNHLNGLDTFVRRVYAEDKK